MPRRYFPVFIIIFFGVVLVSSVSASDEGFNLYRVWIDSKIEAQTLSEMPVDVVFPVRGGYLVSASPLIESRLPEEFLRYQTVAVNIDPESLYRDVRRGKVEPLHYPIIFEDGGVRIYDIRIGKSDLKRNLTGLQRLLRSDLPIVYKETTVAPLTGDYGYFPDSLYNNISQDTLTHYVEYLQSFDTRLSGTSGNYSSANWIKGKLTEFGCDSVAFDISEWDNGHDTYTNRNVVALKRGSVYPYHQIILGAHRDAVEGSPGADDNGSGTAGVMEIARILRDYDSRMSIIFILFDTEEVGLGGSKTYAHNAYIRGDHIEIMINLDMIGHYENENDVYAYHGYGIDSIYAQLWTQLGATLPGINLIGHPESFILSDESSFAEFGYPVLWLFEYLFSTVYHTPQDSTTYLNFNYMTKIVKTTMATIEAFDQNFEPAYELYMTGPEYPQMLVPNMATPVEVVAIAYGGATIVPGSVLLHCIIDDVDTTAIDMTDMGGGNYVADLPVLTCGHIITYYFSAEDGSLGVVYYPKTGSGIRAYVAGDLEMRFDDDFSSDLGWTVSGDANPRSVWERADPSYFPLWGSPTGDFDGSLMCYVTGAGTGQDVDGGTTSLISPIIDASSGDMLFQYARWYSNDVGMTPHTDTFKVMLSNNGGSSWVVVETVGPVEESSGGWYFREFRISDFLTPTNSMRLRFDASDLGDDSHIEAGVDAVKFIRLTDGPRITTESLPNWTTGVPYARQLEAVVCSGELTWSDKNGQLDGTGLTLSSSGLVSGTPGAARTIYFTARAASEAGGVYDKVYSFRINPALTIVTLSIPNGTIGESFNHQLAANGGTGTRVWSDPNGVLEGTGLTVSSSGLISGTPALVGQYSLTARVTDDVGATGERVFNFKIREPFICGDANSDGEVNVGDPLYIINYVFKSGPPPQTPDAADVNYDHSVNVADAVYMINYIFKSGSPPFCP